VLVDEVLEHLRLSPGDSVVDCTVGLGGHAVHLLERIAPGGRLVGLDLDEQNLGAARQRLSGLGGRLDLRQANFSELAAVLSNMGVAMVNAILVDLGLSSNQIEDSRRGFSFDRDGPLDMRIDQSLETTATDLVNSLREKELSELIWQYSQERFSRKIARRICQLRREARITTTAALARAVSSAVRTDPGGRRSKIHPATRTFLALRIAVNREMEHLESLLAQVPGCLAPGGRVAVISFHSLEDGRVKQDFRSNHQNDIYQIVNKRPIVAGAAERAENLRARSAKLRVAERTDKPMN
jgi:16S rRNA (cytosine1402-N4)-methyltransferase